MAYILSAPGTTAPEVTIVTKVAPGGNLITGGNLTITSLQDATINAALDTFQWQQLDSTGKFTVPTTSTNSITTTLVVDPTIFFGSAGATANTAAKLGLLALSTGKVPCQIEINLGDPGATGKTVKGEGYVTGLSPTVSADSPVWTTPVTFSITGDFSFT